MAPVKRGHRVHGHVAPQLVPDVLLDARGHVALEPGRLESSRERRRARRRAAGRFADDEALSHHVLHDAGLRRLADACTTQPTTCRSGNGGGDRAGGSSVAARAARTDPACRAKNHHGTPFIAVSTTVSGPEQRRDAGGDRRQRRPLDRDHDQILVAQCRGVFRRVAAAARSRSALLRAAAMRLQRRQRRAPRDGLDRVPRHAQAGPDEAADRAGTVDADLHVGNIATMHPPRIAIVDAWFAWTCRVEPEPDAKTAARKGAKPRRQGELFATADAISVHLALSERTRGIIGRAELVAMKDGAHLRQHVARPLATRRRCRTSLLAGRIVAGSTCSTSSRCAAAAHTATRCRNVVLTPHLGYVVSRTMALFYRDSVENIVAYLAAARRSASRIPTCSARPTEPPMLTGFFLHLKAHRLPVSTRELLTLLEALDKRVISLSLDDFYTLSRACFVKDEQHFDRFDLAFGTYFKGIDAIFDIRAEIPEEWLKKEFERYLSDEDKKLVEAMGGWDKLMETLKKRLEEQRARHQGGKKWIGTGGTSPFGAYGYNPEGVRIGQDGGGSRSAVKVWDERTFRNLDGDVELNTRNIKVALRRLRRFAREGVPEELDLPGTIEGTARNAGWLDLSCSPSGATA